MPTAFDAKFKSRCTRLMGTSDDDFTKLGRFGEVIIYRPLNGIPRPIKAMVDRGPPNPEAGMPHMIGPHFMVECFDDPIVGVECKMVNTGGDKFDIALWPGQTPKTYSILKRPMQQDNGLVKLECG
jgi:hypothetical protein